jgi:hypothetical protein
MRQNAELLNLRKTSYESGSIVARETGPISSVAGQKNSSCTIPGEVFGKFPRSSKKPAFHHGKIDELTPFVYTRHRLFVIP